MTARAVEASAAAPTALQAALAAAPWLFTALALALAPRTASLASPRPSVTRSSRARSPGSPRSVPPAAASASAGRWLQWLQRPSSLAVVAAAAVAVLCVLLLGPLTGGVAGLLAAPAAALGVRRASVPAAVADDSLPLVLDLMAAALRSGRSPAEALWAVAPVTPAHGDRLRRVADLLHLGATPADAWAVVPRDGPLGSVARLAVRSGTSGIRFAAVLEREAAESRATAHTGRIAAAHRAGVRVLAPLGACFLPAFVCLGIVPVIVGVLSSSGLAAVSGAGS